MPGSNPEAKARENIDRLLTQCGCVDAVGVCESDKTESRPLDLLLPRLLSGQVELEMEAA